MSDTNHLHELVTCGYPLVEQKAKAAVALCDMRKEEKITVKSFKSQMEALITDEALSDIDAQQAKNWIKGAVSLNILLNT